MTLVEGSIVSNHHRCETLITLTQESPPQGVSTALRKVEVKPVF